jgi:hypothetical protein
LGLARAEPEGAIVSRVCDLREELAAFRGFGAESVWSETVVAGENGDSVAVPTCTNEFWTARQRQASSLHEISYRACFKPQLPRFFIQRLTEPGERVYDPFMGRGTTPLEAALLGRIPVGNDINPLSLALCRPRLQPPALQDVARRLEAVNWDRDAELPEDLLVFYHPATLRQILALRGYLMQRREAGELDAVDDWVAMVALNRLTGHSPGFFSVYTLPPNQATSVQAQRRINEKRKQTPPKRDVIPIILKKTRQLLGDCDEATRSVLSQAAAGAQWLTCPAGRTPSIESGSVSLVVTSPPFLNIVQYATDNWLRCWFLGLDAKSVAISTPSSVRTWQGIMTDVFLELARVLKPGGHVAFEVGEVHRGGTRLEEAVLPCGLAAGLEPHVVLVHAQEFTKTANCWGVDNNSKGTNTNRIVVFRKPRG